jgi:nucleotide-binding universal stress UspA family protein
MNLLIFLDELSTSDDTLAMAALWLKHIPAHTTVMMPARHAAVLEGRTRTALAGLVPDEIAFKTAEDHLLDVVCEECASGRYELLIAAPAGRTRLERLLRGSRIGHLVASIETSVLVARHVPGEIRRVLVGVGTAEHALVDVRVAIWLAQAFRAELHVVHVVSQVPLQFTGLEHMRMELDSYVTSGLPGTAILAEARRLIAGAGLEPHIHLREGLVRDELVGEACASDYELLVIGAHSGQGWMSLLLDDIADHVVRDCSIPTLVVRGEPAWI